MRARNSNSLARVEQIRVYVGAVKFRNFELARRNDFGIIRWNCRRTNYRVNRGIAFFVEDIFSLVPDENFCADTAEHVERRGIFHIRAAHFKAEFNQNFGKRAHADAADAYEMKFLQVVEFQVIVPPV